MKKIVSIIIALVSLINVNAQRVEMNYDNTFEPIFEISNISARGTANITLNYSDVIVSINCTGFAEFSNKGVVIDDDHNCLEFVGDIEEEGAATFTVYLSDNAKQANKYIKKVTFITRGNSDITSVIGSNDAGSDTDVKFVGTNRIAIESGFDKISEFEIDFTYNDYVQLKSIMVEYGYFDDELTLTDDSYDYFGDYRYAKKVTYTRPMNSEKWGSLCLPFNYVVDDSKFSVYSIKGAGLNGSNAPITLSKFANGTEVVAGTPVFVYCTEPNLVVSSENVLLTTEDFNSSGLIYEYGKTEALNDGNENPISPSLNYTFYGTMKNVTATDAIFVENDIFKYINGTAKTFQPYRAYFTLEGNNSGTGSLTFRVLNGSNLTSVAGVCGAEGHETDVKWELTDMDNNGSLETLTISGTGAMKNYYNDNPAPWAAFKDDITTAVIEEGVTSIGHYAFYQFTALTSVSIASSVTEIGASAFFGCTNLTTISGASGVTYVESAAFDDTAWLTKLPDGLTYVGHVAYLFKGTDTSVNLDAGTTQIYDNCFWGTGIRVVVIPDGVTSIGSGAFAESGLERAYFLGTTPPTLESDVFLNCIATLVVPATAYEEYSAFQVYNGCTWECGYTVTCDDGITATSFAPIVAEDETVTLGYTGEVPTGCDVRYSIDGGTTQLAGNTFTMPASDVNVTATLIQVTGTCGDYGNEDIVTWAVTDTNDDGSYETLTISGTGAMKNYYNNQPWAAFKDDITTVVIGDGVTGIGGNAFYQFTALTSVTIASSVTTIGNAVFFECTNLATISGATGVTYLGPSAFNETAWLDALYHAQSDGLTYVGHVAYLFKGTDTSVNLDAATTQIYDNCFQGSQITSIIIPASVERIGDNALPHSALEKIYVLRNESTYPNTTQLGEYAFEGCFNLTIVVPAAAYDNYNGLWFSGQGSSILKRGYTVTCGTAGITATSYAPIVAQGETVTLSGTGTIPDGYAFAGYSVTKDGTNPAETVTVTEASGVYSFTMPASNVTVNATTIQLSGTCGAMENDDVNWAVTDTDDDGTYDKLTISGTGAMANYSSSNQPWAAFKSDITTVVIGDGVTRIGGNAFYQFTALTSVTIASSVTTIGNAAFFECTNLATINGASGVTYVDSSAFYGTAWENNLPDGLTYVGHVAYRFVGDGTSVNLDAATTQIYEACFQDSKITSIVIPASVERIGDQAFAHSALQKMYVLRHESSFPEITQLGEYAFEGCFNLTIVVPAAAYDNYNGLWFSGQGSSILKRGYTVTCGTAGITATTDGPLVAEDEVVTLSHNDRADYAFKGYSVKDAQNRKVGVDEEDGVYTFQMPDANVTVTATWEPANKITVTANKVGSNYWTTFYCGEAGYSIDDDEEATAYTATVDNSTVTLHLLGKVIPMRTAAIIIGEDNSISMNRDDYSTAEYSANNDLHGVDVRTLKSTLDNTGTGTFYVLGSTAKNGFGFHKYNAGYMPARKAYLLLDGGVAQASSLTMVFDNETTEIKTTDFTDYTDKADTWYSLDGRKLDKQPTKAGVYINGSRKVVIK